MTAHLTLTMEFQDKTIADLRTQVDKPHPTALREVINLLKGALNGSVNAAVRLQLCGVTASQTINVDVSDMVADTDTTVIDGNTLTWVAESANEDQITIPATDALGATALAAAINAHSVISKIVRAVVTDSANGEVTVYAQIPGTGGNGITLAEAGNGITLGDSALAGGTGDELDSFYLGYNPAAALDG
jgi:hypothetical protein